MAVVTNMVIVTSFIANFLLLSTASANVDLKLKTSTYLHQSREDFLSIALDSSLIAHKWETFDPSNPKVVAMAQGLSPAILRLGGTSCDWVIFNDTSLIQMPIPPTNPELGWKETSILKISDWDRLVRLAQLSNFTILFDANVMLRDQFNQWNSSNFKTFLDYNQKKGYSPMMFELGNEPNNYPAHFNRTITAEQMAVDFASLRKLVHSYALYSDSRIVGADVGNPYLRGKSVKEVGRLKIIGWN